MGRAWTEEEKQALKKIWKSTASLESQMDKLPGRSLDCAYVRARMLGLPPKPRARATLRDKIIKMMKDGKRRTACEIAESLDMPRKLARDILRGLVHIDAVHITAERGRYDAAVYQSGPTPDGMPKVAAALRPGRAKPKRCEPLESETEEQLERRLDDAYRSNARWWPRADLLVAHSFNAMISAGRSAA